jgi:hypothetical protein
MGTWGEPKKDIWIKDKPIAIPLRHAEIRFLCFTPTISGCHIHHSFPDCSLPHSNNHLRDKAEMEMI